MLQQELLRRVVRTLDLAGIEYMVTGSSASSMQGEPRLTHDIDFAIEIDADAVPALVAAFPSPEFYVNAEAAAEAIRTGGMFKRHREPGGR